MDIEKELEIGHRVNGLVRHIIYCYMHTVRPDYKVTEQKQSVALVAEFTRFYDLATPPSTREGEERRPGLTPERLRNVIVLYMTQMSPECLQGSQTAMEQIDQANRYGEFVPGKAQLFSQVNWLRKRSEEALDKEGDFI